MSEITNAFKTKIETNYKMMIGGKERVLPHVTLTQLPGSSNWSISAKEHKRISYVVANEICNLQNKEPMLFSELEFLRNLFGIKQVEIAVELGVNESTVSKWRKIYEGHLEKGHSLVLKQFFQQKLLQHLIEKKLIASNLAEKITVVAASSTQPTPGLLRSKLESVLVEIIDNAVNPSFPEESVAKNSYEFLYMKSYKKSEDEQEDLVVDKVVNSYKLLPSKEIGEYYVH